MPLDLSRPGRFTEIVQTKITPTDRARLQRLLDSLIEQGQSDLTTSSLVRAILVAGMDDIERGAS